jgi:osmotically-inducible protein OsmY
MLFRRALAVIMSATLLSGCVGVQFNAQERSLPAAVGDLRIQTTFNARLLSESSTLFAKVDSTVTEGRMHVTGTVPTVEDRQKVTRIAWSIPAVTEVINDVEVTAAPRVIDAAKDRWVTTRLRSLLIADGTIRDSNYAIDTSNGTIYLNGIAQDEAERERVLRHARSIGEARKVVDYVIMKDDPRRQEAGAANIVLDDAAPSGAGP